MTTFAIRNHRLQIEPTQEGVTVFIMPVSGGEISGAFPLDLRPHEASRLSSEIDAALAKGGHR